MSKKFGQSFQGDIAAQLQSVDDVKMDQDAAKNALGIVHCVACPRQFGQMYTQEFTGSNCAGYIEDQELVFGFGSVFDCSHWAIQDHELLKEGGRVCDFCMPRLVDTGKITFLRTHLADVEWKLDFMRKNPNTLLGDDYWEACKK